MDLLPALVITYIIATILAFAYLFGRMDVNGASIDPGYAVIWPLVIVYKILMIPLNYVYNLGKKHEKKAMEYQEYHAEILAKMAEYRKVAEKEIRELTIIND